MRDGRRTPHGGAMSKCRMARATAPAANFFQSGEDRATNLVPIDGEDLAEVCALEALGKEQRFVFFRPPTHVKTPPHKTVCRTPRHHNITSNVVPHAPHAPYPSETLFLPPQVYSGYGIGDQSRRR